MNVELLLAPRQSGKTLGLIDKAMAFANSGKNAIIVTLKRGTVPQIKRELSGRILCGRAGEVSVTDVRNFRNFIRGKCFDAVLCDEWMFFSAEEQVFVREHVTPLLPEDGYLYLVSTPCCLYDSDFVQTCRELMALSGRSVARRYADIKFASTPSVVSTRKMCSIDKLFSSFLLENVTITNTVRELSSKATVRFDDLYYGHARQGEIISTEICGKYLY